MKKQLIVCLLCLVNSQITLGMTVERIMPDENLMTKLILFHAPTSSSGESKPDMQSFIRPNRHFVAKMDSLGLDRYFSFKTNDDVNALVEAVQQGGGMSVAWYYYEKEVCQNQQARGMESCIVDISGLDKAAILVALYARSKPLGMSILHFVPDDLDYDEAKIILESKQGYVDYLKGSVMQVALNRDILFTRMFNRFNGYRAAEQAIEQLKVVRSY